MKKRVDKKRLVVSLTITITILSILFISGGAEALLVSLTIDKNEVDKGEQLSFLVSVEEELFQEFSDILYMSLILSNSETVECLFDIDGGAISGCDGIEIQKISETDFGYSYNLREQITYNITLDTTKFKAGIYTTEIDLFVPGDVISKKGKNIIIKKKDISMGRCSVRAKYGEMEVNKLDFGTNNKISLYLPPKNAQNGQGHVIAQHGRKRYSFKFKVGDIIENTENNLVMQVEGKSKITKANFQPEDAIIDIDKINNKISVYGENVEIVEAEINFLEGCL